MSKGWGVAVINNISTEPFESASQGRAGQARQGRSAAALGHVQGFGSGKFTENYVHGENSGPYFTFSSY